MMATDAYLRATVVDAPKILSIDTGISASGGLLHNVRGMEGLDSVTVRINSLGYDYVRVKVFDTAECTEWITDAKIVELSHDEGGRLEERLRGLGRLLGCCPAYNTMKNVSNVPFTVRIAQDRLTYISLYGGIGTKGTAIREAGR